MIKDVSLGMKGDDQSFGTYNWNRNNRMNDLEMKIGI